MSNKNAFIANVEDTNDFPILLCKLRSETHPEKHKKERNLIHSESRIIMGIKDSVIGPV